MLKVNGCGRKSSGGWDAVLSRGAIFQLSATIRFVYAKSESHSLLARQTFIRQNSFPKHRRLAHSLSLPQRVDNIGQARIAVLTVRSRKHLLTRPGHEILVSALHNFLGVESSLKVLGHCP